MRKLFWPLMLVGLILMGCASTNGVKETLKAGTGSPLILGNVEIRGTLVITGGPAPVPCVYAYTPWVPDPCPPSAVQTRTETHTPAGCAGIPESLTRTCTPPVVPPVTPPTGGEVLPWGWGQDGQIHRFDQGVGFKKVWVMRVEPGTTLASASFFAYSPEGMQFQITLTCPPGREYLYVGEKKQVWSWQINKPGSATITLTPGTALPSDNKYVPPGDYVVEVLWQTTGSVMVTTTRQTPPAVSGEVLPWYGSDGQIHTIPAGPVGSKKVYLIRIPAGTKSASVHLYTYALNSSFNFVFTPVAGYKYYGYDVYPKPPVVGQINYSGDLGIDLTEGTITPWPANGFLPPGDYVLEITWNDVGALMITSGKQ